MQRDGTLKFSSREQQIHASTGSVDSPLQAEPQNHKMYSYIYPSLVSLYSLACLPIMITCILVGRSML